MLETVAFLALLLTLTVLSFGPQRHFLFLAGMLTPWVTPRLTLGIGVEWYKIVGLVSLGLLVFHRRGPARAGLARQYVPLALYAVLVSALWMFLEYGSLQRHLDWAALGLGAGQTTYKMPVQFAGFLGQLAFLWVVPLRARSATDVRAAIRGYTWGCLVSVGLGVLLWLATGKGYVLGATQEVGVGEAAVSRIGGISGEPKMLGAMLVALIAFHLPRVALAREAAGRYAPLVLLTALLALFLTFSTSSWVGFVASMAVASAAMLRLSRRVAWARYAAIALTVVLPILAVPAVSGTIERRFNDRLFGDTSEVEDQKDNYALALFEDEPRHAVWGMGLGGTDLAVLPYVPLEELLLERTPTAGTNGMRYLGDLGLLGLALWTLATAVIARRLRRLGLAAESVFVWAGFAGMMLTSAMSMSAYLFLLGAVITSARLAARDAAAPPAGAPSLVPTPLEGQLP